MTSPPEDIQVSCPDCGMIYNDWWRPSINFSLGEAFDEAYLDEASSSTCPECGHKVRHDVLIVGQDGVFRVDGQPDEE